MPELEQPKFPTTEKPHLSPNPHDLKTEYEDAGRGTPVIENTEPKAQADAQQAVEIALKNVYEAIDEVYELIGEATEIVTITEVGVQSDAMDAKIKAAKALYYDRKVYTKLTQGANTISFRAFNQEEDKDYNYQLTYTISSKSLMLLTPGYSRVTTVGGRAGVITTDASFEVTDGHVAKLTGQLPYLTVAPVADNTSGFLKIVVLDAEPATYYNGYYYIITEAGE